MRSDEMDTNFAVMEPAAASTGELVTALFEQSAKLVKTEVALARVELLADLKREIEVTEGLGTAALCTLSGLNLLLMAVVLALARVLPGWASALIVAAVVLAAGGLVRWLGRRKRVTRSLARTRRVVEKHVRWAMQ